MLNAFRIRDIRKSVKLRRRAQAGRWLCAFLGVGEMVMIALLVSLFFVALAERCGGVTAEAPLPESKQTMSLCYRLRMWLFTHRIMAVLFAPSGNISGSSETRQTKGKIRPRQTPKNLRSEAFRGLSSFFFLAISLTGKFLDEFP